MKTKYALGIALGLLLIGGATNARADGIDLFTLTDGTNTMTWSLPSSPTPNLVDPAGTSGFVVDGVTVTENGTTTVTQALEFYTSSSFGGASNFPEFPVTLFDLFGAQVFMGSESSPTFVPGSYMFTDPCDSWVLSDAEDLTLNITPSSGVPEPSSLLLVGIGLVSLAPILRKSLRRLA